MTRVSLLEKEKKKKKLFIKYGNKIKNLSKIIKNKKTNFLEKKNAMIKMNKIPKNAHYVRMRNRCYITGRSRGYFRRFGLSRHMIKEMAFRGEIPGLIKASW